MPRKQTNTFSAGDTKECDTNSNLAGMRQMKEEIDREIVIYRVHTSHQLKWDLHLNICQVLLPLSSPPRLAWVCRKKGALRTSPIRSVVAAADIGWMQGCRSMEKIIEWIVNRR